MKFNSRHSIRLPQYDYSSAGAYFVTICAKGHECIFSTIKNNTYVGAGLAPALNNALAPARNISSACIKLTAIGEIIDKYWRNIPNQYENVDIDEYVIMPNHIHGILIIWGIVNIRATARVAPTLGQIIGSFKSKCAVGYLKYIRKNNLNETAEIWQRNYYGHIIRNEKSLRKIREYILTNPSIWQFDSENPNAFSRENDAIIP